MENEKLKVLLCEPGEEARVCEIKNTLKAMQRVVEGPVETLTLDDVVIVCNEEGRIQNSRLNRCVVSADGRFSQFILGTFFICNKRKDDLCSLDNVQISKYMKLYGDPVLGKAVLSK